MHDLLILHYHLLNLTFPNFDKQLLHRAIPAQTPALNHQFLEIGDHRGHGIQAMPR